MYSIKHQLKSSIVRVRRAVRMLTLDDKAELEWLKKSVGPFPPGDFYSPIPDLEEIHRNEAAIWASPPQILEGIDLNERGQLKLLKRFRVFYKELPFSDRKSAALRYHFNNPAFSYSDAIMLYSMIRYAKPRRIIEIGSGFSSCVTLDTNDLFFNGEIATTFIEPRPELFYSLIKRADRKRVRVLPVRLQDVPLSEFDSLHRNDILFIDSTHVSKIDSDINHIFFQILPRLPKGVFVHFHDIFYPFEYPQQWVYEGKVWNEAYMLRAFLTYNVAFKIIMFNTFMEGFHEDFFQKYMPLCLKNKGASIWLQKL